MGSSLLYISIAYHVQKGGGWVQIACKIAYVLNGRPLKNEVLLGQNSICFSGGKKWKLCSTADRTI